MSTSHMPSAHPTGAAFQGGAPIPLPPTFPPGVDPATYRLDSVAHLLEQAAYFSMFSVHDPSEPNVPIPIAGIPYLLAGMNVNERLHRFEVMVEPPRAGDGLHAINIVGQGMARVHIRWRVIPEQWYTAPDREPPPTPLIPFLSQRFTMLDGQFEFDDREHSGLYGFGAGRTFPATEGGKSVLRLGAVVAIEEGLGRFKGLQGNLVVNGFIIPPNELGLNVMGRLIDPSGNLTAKSALTSLAPVPDPDTGAVFMTFLGETDPDHPTTLNQGPDGQMLGSSVHELLRLVSVSFDLGGVGDRGFRSRTTTGPIVGRLSTTLSFNPLNPQTPGTLLAPIPYQTESGVFTFFDRYRCPIGTVNANIVEGRAFTTPLEGAPMPVFRMAGFGPILSGTDPFNGVEGMLSMNGIVSVFPRTLSNMYVMRVVDPDGKFQQTCRQAWA